MDKEQYEQRISELEAQNEELRQFIREAWPFVLLEFPHVPSVVEELSDKYEELKSRAVAFGIEVG